MKLLKILILEAEAASWIDNVTVASTLISFFAAAVVFIYQHRKHDADMFSDCTKSLHSDNEVSRITAAILLRSYLRKPGFRKSALKVYVALLRVLPKGNVQKTLADGLGYIDKAIGHDFQKINMHDVLIKPKSYIKYEITENDKFKRFKIMMQRADFYRSNITECSIHSVNFDKAVFYDARLYKTTFRNCTFQKADFRGSDMNGVKFIDCNLEGAEFKGAKRLETSYVTVSKKVLHNVILAEYGNFKVVAEKDIDPNVNYQKKLYVEQVKKPLLDFLDESGRFSSKQHQGSYKEDAFRRFVFVSRLGIMDSHQQMQYERLLQYLSDTYDMDFITLDRKEYMNYGQLNTIKDTMELCAGVIVFAFSYLDVESGAIHKNLSSDDMVAKKASSYTSPWIQIEAAFASSLKLPTLVVMGNGVECDGIFDDKITVNDSLLFKFCYKGGLSEDNYNVIADWCYSLERTKPQLSSTYVGYEIVPDLAASIHEYCVRRKIEDGWTYGVEFDSENKMDPNLLPYEELSEKEKSINVEAAKEAVKVMMKLR
jgi:hypothetical protein